MEEILAFARLEPALTSSIVLTSVGAVGGLILAAGQTVEIIRTVIIVDDAGVESNLPIEGSRPLILGSANGQEWNPVLQRLPAAALGVFSAVTSAADGSHVLAVGSRYPEESVHEPGALFAATSKNGITWEVVDLAGVPTPGEGSLTMLAQAGQEVMLGMAETGASHLYIAKGLGSGPWREISGPRGSTTYVAAGVDSQGLLLLAGVDEQNESHLWRGAQGSWEELNLMTTGRVVDLERIDDELMAAVSRAHDSSISALTDIL